MPVNNLNGAAMFKPIQGASSHFTQRVTSAPEPRQNGTPSWEVASFSDAIQNLRALREFSPPYEKKNA